MKLGIHDRLCPFCFQIKFLKVEMEKKTKIIKDLQQEVSFAQGWFESLQKKKNIITFLLMPS